MARPFIASDLQFPVVVLISMVRIVHAMCQRDRKGHEVSNKLHKTKQNTCKSLNGKKCI